MISQSELGISTSGRGTYDLTNDIQATVATAGVTIGMCHIFIRHTSASLMLCENADPAVRHDLETFMQRQAPDGDPMFTHVDEGPDDMPAHIKCALTATQVSVPFQAGKLLLGTWQLRAKLTH